MPGAVFLSASVPDPLRAPTYADTADVVAIASAVSALVFVTLGRRQLVWGGHPAITPMIWVVAKELGVEYSSWVKLYQSRHFEEYFPEENKAFQNVRYVDDVGGDKDASLLAMRQRMLEESQYETGVFIGGMEGVIAEFELFQSTHPSARVVPVASTGGAVLEISDRLRHPHKDLYEDFDYVSLLHRYLEISPRERRFLRVEDQPPELEDRLGGFPPK